jgi:hypothetical protein
MWCFTLDNDLYVHGLSGCVLSCFENVLNKYLKFIKGLEILRNIKRLRYYDDIKPYYAASRKVAGSSPDEVDFLN